MRSPICLFSGRVAACYAPGVITRRPSSVVLQALALPAGFPLASSTTATITADAPHKPNIIGTSPTARNTDTLHQESVVLNDAAYDNVNA